MRVLYRAMASGSQNGFAFTAMPGPTVIDPLDLDLLKMVISAGSIVEAGGSSQLGKALFTGVRKSSHGKLWEPASVKNTMLFVLLVSQASYVDSCTYANAFIGYLQLSHWG